VSKQEEIIPRTPKAEEAHKDFLRRCELGFRREDIREELAKSEFELVLHLADKHDFPMIAYTWEKLEPRIKEYYYRLADKQLQYLHSQGLVLKTDRELGFARVDGIGRELWYDGYKAAMDDFKEAGFVAVEPLISPPKPIQTGTSLGVTIKAKGYVVVPTREVGEP